MNERYGATLDEWKYWAETLGLLSDLLPVVSNPTAVLSPYSSIKELGKTPSYYNERGEVVGFRKWSEFIAAKDNITEWAARPDYGIFVNSRRLHAFDVDLDDAEMAGRVWAMLKDMGGMVRVRENSPRFLVAFYAETPFKFRKPILFDKSVGKIEFYGVGKGFAACGTHPSGVRYRWL